MKAVVKTTYLRNNGDMFDTVVFSGSVLTRGVNAEIDAYLYEDNTDEAMAALQSKLDAEMTSIEF